MACGRENFKKIECQLINNGRIPEYNWFRKESQWMLQLWCESAKYSLGAYPHRLLNSFSKGKVVTMGKSGGYHMIQVIKVNIISGGTT
jgi:hypothetical protein